MAKKTNIYKLPSGNYRVRVSYQDESGKRHQKSFTAATLTEAEDAAKKWKKTKRSTASMTVSECVRRYIEAKYRVWSPSTVKSNRSIQRSHIDSKPIGTLSASDLGSADVQAWISSVAAVCSSKTVKNAYGLLFPSVQMFYPDKSFRVVFPQKTKTLRVSPSNDDIRALLSYIRNVEGKGSELEIAIVLAATGTLRLGEICALTSDDIKGNTIHICKDMVSDEYGEWIIKPPKTVESDRFIRMPKAALHLIKNKKGRIIKCNPRAMSLRFARAVKRSGIRKIRFHDLRHYSVSILHAIGVPDLNLLRRGGWSTPHVLRDVYLNEIENEKKKQDTKICKYFDSVF